jgi:hypothetical protein
MYFFPSHFIVFTKRQFFCYIFKLGYEHSTYVRIESGRKQVYTIRSFLPQDF